MWRLKTLVQGRSKSAYLMFLLLSILASPVSGQSISTASSDGSDSALASLDEVHSATNFRRKLGWWYNFWVKYSRPKTTSSPTNSPTPNPTKVPTEFPTKTPTVVPSDVPTTTNSPTSCEDGPEEILDVDFELVLESSDNDITDVTPEEVVEIEQTTLQYLQDNVGGECTFSVQSLVVVKNESATSASVKGTADAKAATAFSINATVSMKTSFKESLEEGLSDGSRRLQNSCTPKRLTKCCLNWAINTKESLANKCVEQWGCKNGKCERKDEKITASLFETDENSYYGEDFTDLMKDIVPAVDSAKSALDATPYVLATCSVVHETLVSARDFEDLVSRLLPDLYSTLKPDFIEYKVENCRDYTSLGCQEIDDIFCDGSVSESPYCEFPCDDVVLPPTSPPTLKPTQKPTAFSTPKPTISSTPKPTNSQGQLIFASYDESFSAPRCFLVGRGCDSGDSLLNSRGNMSPVELHASNTIDDCKDGDAGTYHYDESIDRVNVTSMNGGLLMENTEVLIEAVVWAFDEEDDFAEFYYAADAASPDWEFIRRVQPTKTASLDTINATYTLPVGRDQAVRVVFRYEGKRGACPGGSFDDVDDLVFAVASGNPTVSPSPTLSPTITISPTISAQPSFIGTESSEIPTWLPTSLPTLSPTFTPTISPTLKPTLAPTLYPTLSPTLSLVPTVSLVAPMIAATYDGTLAAPRCSAVGGGCYASESLLKSRGTLEPAEPNASNTIDACEDGNEGVYQVDESVESITVTSINGGPLVVGAEVRIDATVWVWNTLFDTVDIWYTRSTDSIPIWTLITSVKPTNSESLNTVSTRFILQDEGDNAVRVVIRYSGLPIACPGGDYDDVDDLVFAVGRGDRVEILSATYDEIFQAPKCSSIANACYAGPSLLKSRGAVSPGEPNAPNTIDQCEDGNDGTYLSDESIDSIKVTALNGGQLVEGADVRIDAKVWVFGDPDFADFWYAADATLADWQFIDTVNFTVTYQFVTVSAEYTLPQGNLQAVRVVFRYGGIATDCPGGSYDDVDDLVFVVGSG